MIIRSHVACGTCNKEYILRIQLGYSNLQNHQFNCGDCNEIIEISLNLNQSAGKSEINYGKNCIESGSVGGEPLYLSSEIVADAKQINDELYFPSMHLISQLSEKVHDKGIALNFPKKRASQPNILWESLQKAWRLDKAKKYHLANKIHDQFSKENNTNHPSFRENMFWFLDEFLGIDKKLFEEVKIIKESNEKEFFRFLSYFQKNLREKNRQDFYDSLNEFFLAYSDFSQVLIYVHSNLTFPENAKVTSTNFDGVKKFYANCYEFYAGAITTYTCLNNIKTGRSFDQLENITLEKYVTTDKAERRKTFASNQIFSQATLEFNSAIRNASFHNWFKLLDNKFAIEYKSGGTGKIHVITYANYLLECTTLLRQICNLLAVELLLDEIICNQSFVYKNRSMQSN